MHIGQTHSVMIKVGSLRGGSEAPRRENPLGSKLFIVRTNVAVQRSRALLGRDLIGLVVARQTGVNSIDEQAGRLCIRRARWDELERTILNDAIVPPHLPQFPPRQ